MAASEAEILRALNLGTSRQVLENKGNTPLSELLVTLVSDVVDRLKDALKARDINTTSQGLSQSIGITGTTIEGSRVSVGIEADFYWKYVNYGVNGTEVNRGAPTWGPAPAGSVSFHQAIKEWIPKRGLQLPPEFSSYDSFAFAIMTGIRRDGIEARPFFEDVVNERLVEQLREPIELLIGKSIEINIISPFQ